MDTDYPYPPGSRLNAYLRDSGHARQNLSIPQQESEIRAWCAARGYELPEENIYRDVAKSSKRGTVGRAAFQALTQHYAAGGKEGLLLWDLRRWGRSLASSLYWFLDIYQRGVRIHIVSEPIPDGPYGLMIVVFKLIGADEENKAKALDTLRGQHYFINRHAAHFGRVPIGYRSTYVQIEDYRDGQPHEVARAEIDPDAGPRITEALRLRALGHGLHEIRRLTGLRLRSATLAAILRNPAYLGRYSWGDVTIDDYYPPLTDPETFAAAQAVNDARSRLGPRRADSHYLLSGLLYCAACGEMMTATSITKPSGRVYSYYLCPTDPHPDRPVCRPNRRYKTAEVEDRLLQRLRRITTTPEDLADIHARIVAAQAKQPDIDGADAAELVQVRRKIANISAAVADGMYTRDLAREQKTLEAREAELEAKLSAKPARRAAAPDQIDPAHTAALNAELWAMIDAAGERQRQAFVRSLVERVVVTRIDGLLAGEVTLRDVPGLGDAPLTLPL